MRRWITIGLFALLLLSLFVSVQVKKYASSDSNVYVVVTSQVYFNNSGVVTRWTFYFFPTATVYGKNVVFSPASIGVYVNKSTVSYVSLKYTSVQGDSVPYFVFSTVPRTVKVDGLELTYTEKSLPLILAVKEAGVSWSFWITFVLGPVLLILSLRFVSRENVLWAGIFGMSVAITAAWLMTYWSVLHWAVQMM